jgi:hypothetical protein
MAAILLRREFIWAAVSADRITIGRRSIYESLLVIVFLPSLS